MLKHIFPAFIILFLQSAGVFALGGYAYTDNVAPSKNPPASLTPAQVPQFVVWGFDDNKYEDGIAWASGLMRSRVNPKGTGNPATYDSMPARAGFYILALPAYNNPLLKNALFDLYLDGNELGNHTLNHLDGAELKFTAAVWDTEITACLSFLTDSLSIPSTDIWGFRTPFLAYNNAGFTSMKSKGFVYDCSIEEGEDTLIDGTNFVWPYTLDNGSPGAIYSAGSGSHEPVDSSHKGLWELPAYLLIVPPDSVCSNYNIASGLRHRMYNNLIALTADSSFDTLDGKITGLDYNVWYDFNTTADEYLAILKYTLDLRMKGNRAPFICGAHSDFYSIQYIGDPIGCKTNYLQRRTAMEQFLDYALSMQQVRVVPPREVIRWMRNPVALGQSYSGPCTLTVATVGSGTIAAVPQKASYAKNETVALSATPATGWVFDRWAGADLTAATQAVTIPMYKNISVKAVFRKEELVLDTTQPSPNLVRTAAWGAEVDDSSHILAETDTGDVVSATFLQAPTTPDFIAWVTFTAAFSSYLTNCIGVEVEYKCDKPLIIQFSQRELENDGSYAFYQYVAPMSESQWNNVLVPVGKFYQPDWTPLASKKSLKLNTSRSLVFIPAINESGDTGTVMIRKLRLFYGAAGVHRPVAVRTASMFSMHPVRPGLFVLNVPQDDEYTVRFFSVNGSEAGRLANARLARGANMVRLGRTALAAGVYLVNVKSRTMKSMNMKMIVK